MTSGSALAVTAPVVGPAPLGRAADGVGTVVGRIQNSATGQYLENARISIVGTDLETFTDSLGYYRLVGIPAGAVEMRVFYSGLDAVTKSLAVAAGGTVEQDIGLTSAARYGQTGSVVQLDSFVVASERETDSSAIAVNEQRFAPNIKNVVSTDAVGDVLGGSVGEFLKFMPGVTAEYAGNEVVDIAIRGISGAMTSFTTDGAPMVFASFDLNSGRTFSMYTQDINDAARIEVTKVPTPATPADSLAGSVNMVSKSAFERDRARFRYGIGLIGNSENLTLKRTPHSYGDRRTYKVFPSVNFDYTLPINKRFGIVLTGLHAPKTGEIHRLNSTYETAGTATGASLSRPYLRQFQLNDGPRTLTRTNLSFKADWRVTPNSVLSLGVQWNEHETEIGTNILTPNAGNNGTSTVAGGRVLSFGPDFTEGATGRGTVTMTGLFQNFGGGTTAPNLTYRFDNGQWKIDGGLSGSRSYISRHNRAHGHFMGLTASLNRPVRLQFAGIKDGRPTITRAFDNNNVEVDLYDIANYSLTGANDGPYDRDVLMKAMNLKAKRRLNVFPFPSSIEAGGAHRIYSMDYEGFTANWNYGGPDGNAATADPVAPYRMQVYVNQNSYFGFRNLPWISPDRAWRAYQENPRLFLQTPAQVVAQENNRITVSRFLEESVSAGYLQGEAGLLRNRLRVLTGVRYERTTDKGQGAVNDQAAVFLRNPDGSFVRNAQGARVRKPEAGAPGSMEELRLTRKERGYRANRTYDGYYPSLHLSWSATENVLLRGAYARTYGRPNFNNIIPIATINEADLDESQAIDDPSISRGNITVNNIGLRPWTADNYDLSVEFYTPHGGVVSGGVFLKEIRDFFADTQRLATAEDVVEFGLDARYVGWTVTSMYNAGAAQIVGAEINLRQSLQGWGRWGRHFTLFANGTKLELRGDQQASFESFVPETANWGVAFNSRRWSIVGKWNYRGVDKRTPAILFGPDGYQYQKSRVTLDLNVSYALTRSLSLAASVTNVFYTPTQVFQSYGSQTPDYARQSAYTKNGVPLSVMVKGTF